MSTKCDYDCGQEAKFILKNGKNCCSKTHTECPEISKKCTVINHIKVTCDICGKEVTKACLGKHRKFCSFENFCLHCGNKIPKNKKFCNKRCAGYYNNKNNPNLVNCKRGPDSSKSKKCSCGKTTESKSGICNECVRKNKIENWLKNPESVTSPKGYVRVYLIEKNNYSCEICGWNIRYDRGSTSPLQMHHKDGNLKNNNIINLEILCPNCHSLTDNYGSRNSKNNKRV